MVATTLDINRLRSHVEGAMEALLRAADARVCWTTRQDESTKQTYRFLPGLYVFPPPHDHLNPAEATSSTTVPAVHVEHTTTDENGSKIRLLLHGDNTFEYFWSMKRSGTRAMEHSVEITGEWHKPILNRTRRGDDDQRLFLTARKMRFQRCSNYDQEAQTWKVCLKTLTRHGCEWANVGDTERGIPSIIMVFTCADGTLESTGNAMAAQVLTNSPACRVLAGLTKKIANKLGAPVDVMTDKWLPPRGVVMALVQDDQKLIHGFNPLTCLAEAPVLPLIPHRLPSCHLPALTLHLVLMATPPAAAAAAASGDQVSKNTPPLHSVATSLRNCLDGMLPDGLRNDSAAFSQHLTQQKQSMQGEKNSWRFGLNYLFETLKQHKDWYVRNQQFVQLRKDVKRFDSHVSTIRGMISESVSKLELEAGLREAELEGRVGAYKIMFEVTKIASRLSRPLVKLQILKPSDSSLSIYCDTFVLDIVLAGGDGAVESASLMTVEKDQTKQFPERDEDLLIALRQLSAGDSAMFMEKLIRLVNRAELAVKYPSINFEQLEEEVYAKIAAACDQQKYWIAKRAMDGITIQFKNPLYCRPIIEPPRKKMRVEEPSADSSLNDRESIAQQGNDGDTTMNDESAPKDVEALTPLANGEWSGSISFIEWRGEVALHVVGYTPMVMVGVQARRLALAAMRAEVPSSMDVKPNPQQEETHFNEFVTWTAPDGSKPISPQLHFARDHSFCSVFPTKSNVAMRQEFSLTTKEISGGLRLRSFPVPISNASDATIANVLQICGQSLFFHSVLLTAFFCKSTTFGRRIPVDSEEAITAAFKVDVVAPDRITMKAGELWGPNKHLLIEIETKMDCTLEMRMKFQEAASPKANAATIAQAHIESPETLKTMTETCHSIPLLTYYALKRSLQSKTGKPAAREAESNGADCNGITALDEDDLSVSMKIEGEDMLLDDMGLF